MKAVIGLVGMPLAGKETVAKLLARFAEEAGARVHHARFRDVLEETLRLWDIPCNRENLQKLAQIMVRSDTFGADALTHAVQMRLESDSADIIIADGVRWLSDEKMLRSIPHGRGLILYVDADTGTRYARAKQRGREGEETLTRERFEAQDRALNEQFVEEIGGRADWRIPNGTGTDESALTRRVKRFFDEWIMPFIV